MSDCKSGRDEGAPREIFRGSGFPLRDRIVCAQDCLYVPFDEFQNHLRTAPVHLHIQL